MAEAHRMVERNSHSSDSRRGSVLMEFVVVAPLYFALLGGTFFVGELMLNRIRLQVGDHAGTWMAGTRLMDRSGGGDAISSLMQNWLFHDTHEVAGAITVEPDSDKLNNFMSMYCGGIKRLSISVPNWMRGMLFMHQAFSGGDMEDLKEKRTYDFFSGEDFHRSYSFHRNPAWPDTHDRSASALDLVNAGILQNVLGDSWIVAESDVQQTSGSSGGGGCVNRALSGWSE